jgi:cyclic beta-1,2-glucan synthetase
VINPCIPAAWPGFSATFRHGAGSYEITVVNPAGVCRGVAALELDGVALADHSGVPLTDDGKVHTVRVTMGAE